MTQRIVAHSSKKHYYAHMLTHAKKPIIQENVLKRAIKDNPDLPPAFIKEILLSQMEVKAGKTSEFAFGT